MTIAVISMIRDPWGGSEELWYEMAKEALRQGHDVIHLAYFTETKHPKVQELENLGLRRLRRPGLLPGVTRFQKYVSLATGMIRKKINDPITRVIASRPDIILYNGTCYSVAQEKTLMRHLPKKRFAFFILGHLNNESMRAIDDAEASRVRIAYAAAEKVFFVSARNLETAQRQLCATIPNAYVVRNPVNMQSKTLLPFPPLSQKIRFAMVGNLVTVHKGQDLMISALSKLKFEEWELSIYGSGYDRRYLEELAQFMSLDKKITFRGTINDIRSVWEDHHALLMPSHMEGMPLAVVEAMLCGRVCIATDVGGNGEWIEHGVNGYLIEAPTIDLMVTTLNEAIGQKDSWPEIGRSAHERAAGMFDPRAGLTLLKHLTK